MNPLCACGCDVENTCHNLLHCPNFLTERNTLLNKITNIDSNILNQADATITKTLVFGNSKYSNEINLQVLNASVDFILTSERFDEPLKFLTIKIYKDQSISVCLSVSLIKTICQFEHKLCFFIFSIICTSISDCFSLLFFFFPGTGNIK